MGFCFQQVRKVCTEKYTFVQRFILIKFNNQNSKTIHFLLFLGNIRNIDVKYSHCGPIPFQCRYLKF